MRNHIMDFKKDILEMLEEASKLKDVKSRVQKCKEAYTVCFQECLRMCNIEYAKNSNCLELLEFMKAIDPKIVYKYGSLYTCVEETVKPRDYSKNTYASYYPNFCLKVSLQCELIIDYVLRKYK